MSKTLEKLVDFHMKEEIPSNKPVHSNQFASEKGKSTIEALYAFTSSVQKAGRRREIAIAAFLHIEGAFSNTSMESIFNSAESHEVSSRVNRWLRSMPCDRIFKYSLHGCNLRANLKRGCSQGEVLGSTLWAPIIDDLMRRLNKSGFYIQGNVDELAILVRGKREGTLFGIL